MCVCSIRLRFWEKLRWLTNYSKKRKYMQQMHFKNVCDNEALQNAGLLSYLGTASQTSWYLKMRFRQNVTSTLGRVKRPRRRTNQSGVNFINILRTNFLYERRFGSLHVTRENDICIKMRVYNIYEIDSRCQFHQHFTLDFFIQKCFAKLFSTCLYFGLEIFLPMEYWQKSCS